MPPVSLPRHRHQPLPLDPLDQFPRCATCTVLLSDCGDLDVLEGSWLPVTLDYGTIRTYVNGVLTDTQPNAFPLTVASRTELTAKAVLP